MIAKRTHIPAQPAPGHFDDFDRFAEATRGWDLDFRQLDRGPLSAEISQVISPESLLTRVRFSRALDQRGCSPRGFRTFGFLDDGVSGVRWCGREATDKTLLAFDATGEFNAVSHPGFSAFTYSISEERLGRVAEILELPGFGRQGASRTFSAGQIAPIIELKRQARELCDAMVKDASPADNPWMREALEFDLPGQILSIVTSGSANLYRPPTGSRQAAVNKARAYIRDNLTLPLTVRQICTHTGVSWRTLDYAFREHFQMTPQRYLKAIRLDEVRRKLCSGACATVTQAAHLCGFWHMGKFAADYRAQFAELPSSTLRRSAR